MLGEWKRRQTACTKNSNMGLIATAMLISAAEEWNGMEWKCNLCSSSIFIEWNAISFLSLMPLVMLHHPIAPDEENAAAHYLTQRSPNATKQLGGMVASH